MYTQEESKNLFSLSLSQVYLNLNRLDEWVNGTKFQTYGWKEKEKIRERMNPKILIDRLMYQI